MTSWPSSKARQVLSALYRIGWTLKRQSGSHKTLSRPCMLKFNYTKVAGQRMLSLTPEKVSGMLRAMQKRPTWEGVVISPDSKPGLDGEGQYPVLSLGWYPGFGYEVRCMELSHESYFVATNARLSQPEVYVELLSGERNRTSSTILSVRGDHIIEYPVPDAAGELYPPRDVDNDGRADLPCSGGMSVQAVVPGERCEYWRGVERTPYFLAHSLRNGSFSLNDEVAKNFVKTWCQLPPKSIRSAQDAICERVWAGQDPAKVDAARRRVEASCVHWDCGREYDNQPQAAGALATCQSRRDAFEHTPPLILP